MSLTYKHIKDALTHEQVEEQVFQLCRQLRLGEPEKIDKEVLEGFYRNVLLVDAIARAGVNLQDVHDIEQWAFFDRLKAARKFGRAVKASHKGFRVLVAGHNGEYWPVVIYGRTDLQLETVGRITRSIRLLAAAHRGWYEGFEATIASSSASDFEPILGERFTVEQLAGCGISQRPGFEFSSGGV